MSLYLRDARFIDWRTLEVTRGHLRVDEGPDALPAFVGEIPDGAHTIPCDGRLVTRAFAIGHHHIYSTLARGMPPPPRIPRNFREILELIWWNLDRKLDADMIRASALACAVEAARCGCTFLIDHHSSPNAAAGSLGLIAEALEEVGVGHLLCLELSDRDGPAARDAGLAETERHLDAAPGLVGLHASFTVSDELLLRAVELARGHGTGIHIHVAEAGYDEAHCEETHGCRVVSRLNDAGALDFDATILAHCLHVDDAERKIIQESRAWVVHCTQSNQNNAVGAFHPRGLGDRIFLGTDGMHSDPLSGLRAAYLEGQPHGLSPAEAHRRLRRVHDYLDLNEVPGGGRNDYVVLEDPSPTPVTGDNWPAHLVYGPGDRPVRTVIREGRVIVEDGRVVSVDSERILAHAREQATRLWDRL